MAHDAPEVRYDSVRDGPITLTLEEAAAFVKQASKLRELLSDNKVVAKYKLEVMFGKARSTSNPTPGVLSFWSSGSKFHGGGDEKLYLCPGKSLGKSECNALLQADYNTASGVVCPACGTIWQNDAVIGELFLNLPMRKWADVLYTYYRLCDYNCDIYLKFAPLDIRTTSMAQVGKTTWAGSQRLEATRSKRARHVYPLRNIIKDTSAGADLLSRFYAFLVA